MVLPGMNTTLVPNPRDHPDNANLPTVNQPATVLGVTITFLLLAATAMSLRLWVRLRDNLWGWDDAFVFLAGISSIIGDCLVCLMPDDGLGLHLWTLDGEHLVSYFKHVYSTNIAYCISATFIKLSILCQYLRLFAETMPTGEVRQYYMARRVTITLIVICGLWGLAFTILSVFSCNPVRKNWTQNIPGRCIGWGSKVPSEFFTMFVGHSASNMTLDILVLLTPVPFLGLLRLAGKSRAGLITLFIMGCIVASVAVGRVVSFCINRAGTIPVLDMPYHTPIIYIFSVLELNLAIIAASIPIFWPVIAKLASNKIWVVNEIEIHVEETQRDSFSSSPRGGSTIGLKDQSAWKADKVDDYGSKPSAGVSVVAKTYERSTSRQAGHDTAHRHKTSTASSHHRPLDIDLGTRASQESHRALYRAPSSASLSRSEREDWMAQIDKVGSSAGRTTTKIESAELPLAHIRATER